MEICVDVCKNIIWKVNDSTINKDLQQFVLIFSKTLQILYCYPPKCLLKRIKWIVQGNFFFFFLNLKTFDYIGVRT